MTHDDLNDKLAFQLDATDIPYEREFMAVKPRRWRWDFHLTGTRWLVEVNGGTWTKGGHSTGAGIQRDYRKFNAAQLRGWRQLTFTADDVHDGTAVRQCEIAVSGILEVE